MLPLPTSKLLVLSQKIIPCTKGFSLKMGKDNLALQMDPATLALTGKQSVLITAVECKCKTLAHLTKKIKLLRLLGTA